MARADSGLDITSAAGTAVQQIHDLLARNRLSVSLAADTCELPGDREVAREVGLEMELEGDSAKVPRRERESLFSTGWPQLDAIFPEGGLRQGMLLECLGALQGGGVALLGLWFAWQMLSSDDSGFVETVTDTKRSVDQANSRRAGVFVVFDNDRRFYPPVAAALGISLERVMIVTPESKKDLYWALDQVLRCPAVGAVWSCMSKMSSREFRRLQLAAEAGRALGVLVRESKFERDPTWAHVRLKISAALSKKQQHKPDCENRQAGQYLEVLKNPKDLPVQRIPEMQGFPEHAGDWRFHVERKRAVSAMVGHVMGASGCEIDLREIVETSGVGHIPQAVNRVSSPISEPVANLLQFGKQDEIQGSRQPGKLQKRQIEETDRS